MAGTVLAERAPGAAPEAAPVVPASTRRVLAWETATALVVFLVGGFLHFLFELSGFNPVVAPFASVNESTWEHLKLFYWPAVVMAVIQHAYLRHGVRNFWAAKGVSVLLTAVYVVVLFYAYVGIVLPIEGKGTLAGTLVTAAIAIVCAQYASFRLLTTQDRGRRARILGIAILVAFGIAYAVFTFAPPRIFLFENFFGYRYDGGFGILPDYTPYLVFK